MENKKDSVKQELGLVIVTTDEKNDLAATICKSFSGVTVLDTVARALDFVKNTSGVKGLLILADGYPSAVTSVSEEQASRIKELGVRTYIEYPSPCDALGVVGYGECECVGYGRAVVTSPENLGMDMYSILYVHGAKYVKKTDVSSSWLVCATVAGYDIADYGLSDSTPHSLLELSPDKNTLISSTKLSQFISARYAPYKRWQCLWRGVLSWLSQTEVSSIEWQACVRPKYKKGEKLASDAYEQAVRLNSDWYLNSGMLNGDDGKEGIFEGFISGKSFDEFGRQELRKVLRADCIGESVGALALASALLGQEEYKKTAYNAMKWLLNTSPLSQEERADITNPQYGLLSWHNFAYDQYYGDDNAKSIIGLILAAEALGVAEFDCRILEAIMANFRTTGINGFRGARIMTDELNEKGWRHFYNGDTVYYSAHFEALPWACYLWAYNKTGYKELYDRTLKGIGMMMQAYKNTMSRDVCDKSLQWEWSNGMQQERAKMILPLAWLVRLSPTDEHISWLDTMINDIVVWQDAECGALADAYGEEWEGNGLYGPFKTNSDYGKHEAPVIQKNGDPCSDSLYTASFAMVTLLEAEAGARAIGRTDLAEKYHKYVKLLSDYHVKIQQICDTDVSYNGVWFRGFDFEKWETYGSDGDAGWGIWCVETGWSQSWISSALSLQAMGTNVWDYTKSTTMREHIADVVSRMIECDKS